jgi:hypothetical protein
MIASCTYIVHNGNSTDDITPVGQPRTNDSRDESLARRDGHINRSHPSKNKSHARQEDGSQYECLEGRDGLPRKDGGTSEM